MKLITNTQITVDGVMQANGGNNPVLDPGFDRGGWAMPLGERSRPRYIGEFYQRAEAFLFGRRTYELFAGYWGCGTISTTRSSGSLNSRPKFVASNTIGRPASGPRRPCSPEISRRPSGS